MRLLRKYFKFDLIMIVLCWFYLVSHCVQSPFMYWAKAKLSLNTKKRMNLYSKALFYDKDHVLSLQSRSKIFSYLKYYDQALKDIDHTLKLNPKNSLSWYLRGEINFKQNKYNEAYQDFSKALGYDENYYWAYQSRSKVLKMMEKHRRSKFDEALFYYYKRDHQKAKQVFDELLLKYPNDAKAYELRGKINEHFHDWDSALSDYKASFDLYPQNPWPLYHHALLLFEMKEYDQSKIDLKQIIKIDPYFSKAYQLLRLICELNNDEEQICEMIYLEALSHKKWKRVNSYKNCMNLVIKKYCHTKYFQKIQKEVEEFKSLS